MNRHVLEFVRPGFHMIAAQSWNREIQADLGLFSKDIVQFMTIISLTVLGSFIAVSCG